MKAGITPAGTGLDGTVWNILGQTYMPKQHGPGSFTFEALFPPGTFVPPHIHPDQDEFFYVLSGRLELMMEGAKTEAGPGDFVRLPMGVAHGIFNESGGDARALFSATPSGRLHELFSRIDGVLDPEQVMRIAAECGVVFLPPPG